MYKYRYIAWGVAWLLAGCATHQNGAERGDAPEPLSNVQEALAADLDDLTLPDRDIDPTDDPLDILNPPPPDPPAPPEELVMPDDPIVPTSDRVGAIPATWAVEQGRATYRIPIEVPKGRAGMQPDLALSYTSGAGNGPAGVGWSVTGLSSIKRCAKTIALDGRPRGVNFDDKDAYCLDGERLRSLPPNPALPDAVEMRTERDSLARVLLYGSLGDPTRFEVWGKDGRISTYERLAAKRIQPTTLGSGYVEENEVGVAWVLTRAEDRAGNAITISYDTRQNTSAPFDFAYAPRNIEYTSRQGEAPRRKVRFVYQSNPDDEFRYVSGVRLSQPWRLQRLEMYALGWQSPDTTLAWEYRLSYEESPTTGRSRLHRVERCGAEGSCLRAKVVEYDDTPLAFKAEPVAAHDAPKPHWLDGEPKPLVIDADGDGRDDLIYRIVGTARDFEPSSTDDPTEDSLWIRLGTADGLGAPIRLLAGVGVDDTLTFSVEASIKVDVNASGKMAFTAKGWGDDPIYPLLRFNPSTKRLDSAGLAFPGIFATGGSYLPLRAVAADLDGDGRAEIVHRPYIGDDSLEWHIRWNRAGSFSSSQVIEGALAPCAASARVLDKSGDGRGDVLFGCASMQILTTSDTGALVVEDAEDLYDDADSLFADMNGDGLDDLVFPIFDDGATGVSWNTGRGFGPVETVPNGPLPDVAQNNDEGLRTADFNGDGRADFIVFHDSLTREIEVSLSTATGGYRPTMMLPFDSGILFINGDLPWGASRVGDFNGDGQTDLVHVNSTTSDWEVLLNRGVDTDRVVAVRDEAAEQPQVRFFYARVRPDSSNTCIYPQVCQKRGVPVVQQLWESQGSQVAAFRRTIYGYRDLRFDWSSRKSLGFGEIRMWEPERPRETRITYDHTTQIASRYPLAGSPSKTVVITPVLGPSVVGIPPATSAPTTRIVETVRNYALRPLHSGLTYFVYPYTWTENEWEQAATIDWADFAWTHVSYAGSSKPSTRREQVGTQALDEFANVTQVATITTGGQRHIVSTTYDNLTEDWLIGLPRQRLETEYKNGSTPPAPRKVEWTYDDRGLLRVVDIEKGSTNESIPISITYSRNPDGLPWMIVHSPVSGEDRRQYIDWGDASMGDERVFPKQSWTDVNGIDHSRWTVYHPATGDLVAEMDSNGVTVTRQYDEFHRLRAETPEGGAPTGVTYEALREGSLVTGTKATVVRGGAVAAGREILFLDELSRPIEMAHERFDGALASSRQSYDVLGRVVRTTRRATPEEAVQVTHYSYDTLDRLVEERRPDGSRNRYEHSLLETTSFDAEGREHRTKIDWDGRLVSSTRVAPEGTQTLRYVYEPFSLLGKVINESSGNLVLLEQRYDQRGRRRWYNEPVSALTSVTYNAFGEVVALVDSMSTRTFERDALGRVEEMVDADGETEFVWDTAAHGVGRLASSTSPDGVQKTFAYDAHGRPEATTWTIDGSSYVIQQTYDALGRVDLLEYPSVEGATGFQVKHRYNAHGYLHEVVRRLVAGNGTISSAVFLPIWRMNSRNSDDQPLSVQLGATVETTYSYEPLTGRLDRVRTPGAYDLDYDYYLDGRVKRRYDRQSNRDETFGYDAREQLRWWELQTSTTSTRTDYSYDALGNVKEVSVDGALREEYVFGPPYRPSEVRIGGAVADTLSYDVRGRLFSRGGPRAPMSVTFTEFDLPRLVVHGGGTTSFQYDADGKRVMKEGPSETVLTLGRLYERRTAGAQTTHVFHVFAGGEEVAQHFVHPDGSSQDRFVQKDALGSVGVVLRPDGSVLSRNFHEPFGGRIDENGGPIAGLPLGISDVRTGFTGHEHDDELGWIDMQGRVYDPSVRRFLTSDPVIPSPLTAQGYNPYAYVLNDPLNLRDPTGFQPCDGTNCTPNTPETIAPPPGVIIDSDGTGAKEVNVFEDGEALLPEDDGSIEGSGGDGGASPGGGLGGAEGGPSSEGDRGELRFSIAPMTGADARLLLHTCLDACGFAPPPIGPTCDVVNACFYSEEGDTENAALSLMAAPPGAGDVSKLYSSLKGAGQVGKAGRMAREAGATQAARGGSRAAAAANLRRMGLEGVNLAGETYNSGRKALERAGFVLERTTDTGRRVFKNSQTGAEVFYDSGRALAPGQKPHWHIRDAGGNRYDRSGRIVDSDEVAGHIPGG
ncbi:RHS repeat-associated core domain-containing protein [Sorangium sp. So ce296]|uniref:RHS repeat-associated core domain-containing protein n=1 Tax=Sorangium sp. So ce296 TaxID=3133296 RepID=UPI003F5F25B5